MPKLLLSWEFYNFDVDRDGTSLTPWFGQLKSAPESLGTNILSLATSEAEKVDQMFRGIVSTTFSDKALVLSIPDLTQIEQDPGHEAGGSDATVTARLEYHHD